jgi:hypothetical protein
MRRLLLPLALLASACGDGRPPPRPHAAANPAAPAAAPAQAPAPPAANVAQPPTPPNPARDPAVAGLSPAQRRAYDLGYRDCSHGRYAPDNHLEAYRIGCGAAHDQGGERSN